MDYTKKHKNLIAKLFKKAGMVEEASIVLSRDEYKYEIANAMRDAAKKAIKGRFWAAVLGSNVAIKQKKGQDK